MKTINTSVETELVCSDDGKNTYCITKRLNGVEGETGIIVMLFPTRNEKNLNADDSTINHLVAHMSDFGFSEIKIINLFSKVVSARPSSRGLTIDNENMNFIENSILSDKDLKNQKFIVAWGNSMESSRAVNEIKRKVINLYLKKLPKGKIYQIVCPERGIADGASHPLYLGIRAKTALWRLMEYNPKPLFSDTKTAEK